MHRACVIAHGVDLAWLALMTRYAGTRIALCQPIAQEEHMKIAQLMTRNVKTCRRTDTLDVAAKLMWDYDIGVVPVVDDFGQVVGIVTDRDACMAAFMQCQPLHCLPCTVAMSKHVVTCRPDDTDAAVAKLMAQNKIRRVPVVDDSQKPIGMVSLNDLAITMAKGREVPAIEVAGTLAAICEHRPTAPFAAA
jgi:CBS domain-containing protein